MTFILGKDKKEDEDIEQHPNFYNEDTCDEEHEEIMKIVLGEDQ